MYSTQSVTYGLKSDSLQLRLESGCSNVQYSTLRVTYLCSYCTRVVCSSVCTVLYNTVPSTVLHLYVQYVYSSVQYACASAWGEPVLIDWCVRSQTKQMEVKDSRVRFMSEILNGIKARIALTPSPSRALPVPNPPSALLPARSTSRVSCGHCSNSISKHETSGTRVLGKQYNTV